jgi:hypothetical protein
MTKRNSVHFEEKIIPAHTIYNCEDCPNFLNNGAPYGDGSICMEDPMNDVRTVSGDIPDWCPFLKSENET